MILAIIQARSGSTRLPGKVTMQINGQSLVEHAYRRAKSAIGQAVVAIPANDKELEDHLITKNIPYYKGSENDVLLRYYMCAKAYGADRIVRITADCPCIPVEVMMHVASFRGDLVSNAMQNRTYPDGWDVEVISFRALEWTESHADSEESREHVLPYLYTHMEQASKELKGFTALKIDLPINLSETKWSIDTQEDFDRVKNLMEKK
jgi:spore coat polysaccharide biosynthesis protein SpsF